MTNEQKLEIIRFCIDDIKSYCESDTLSLKEKQRISKALETYKNMYRDAERGKLDPDLLHENIASFLYYLQ